MSATAVLLATSPATDGTPAALLEFEGQTLLRRLVDQLASLDITSVVLVCRPEWEAACAAQVAGSGLRATVRSSCGVADDLSTIAAAARRVRGTVVVAHADIATHREALAGLLADPRLPTGILTTGRARASAFPIRSARGRVVSAGSPFHSVKLPNGTFLGVLKVDDRSRGELADVADELVALCTNPRPQDWDAELARKTRRWTVAIANRVASDGGEAHEPGGVDTAEKPRARDEADAETSVTEDAVRVYQSRHAGDEGLLGADLEADDDVPALDDDGQRVLDHRVAVAMHDAPALLLVGLVRRGVHVGDSYLRSLFWSRPLSPDAVAAAEHRIRAKDEDRVLLASAVKANDSFFTTFFVSPYSKYLARWAARRRLTPNQITTLSLVIGILAAAAFAHGSRAGMVAGAVLLQVAFTADCVDGQLARYTRTFSKLGAWLDSVFDRTKEYAVFVGLAIGAERGFADDVWLLAAAALTLQTFRHTVDFSYAQRQHQIIASIPRVPLSVSRDVPVRQPVHAHNGVADRGVSSGADNDASPPSGDAPHEERESLVRAAGRSAVHLSRVSERRPGARWVKKIIILPIGERFALISITAALWSPRVTFVVLLTWGLTATAYSLTGRILRSVAL